MLEDPPQAPSPDASENLGNDRRRGLNPEVHQFAVLGDDRGWVMENPSNPPCRGNNRSGRPSDLLPYRSFSLEERLNGILVGFGGGDGDAGSGYVLAGYLEAGTMRLGSEELARILPP